jgi:hypothetical protein
VFRRRHPLERREGLKAGRLEGGRTGRREGLKAGRLEGLKAGRLEGGRAGRRKGGRAGGEALLPSDLRVLPAFQPFGLPALLRLATARQRQAKMREGGRARVEN